MVGNLTNYQASEKTNTPGASRTRKRAPLSKSDALGILSAAFNECIEAGLSISVLRGDSNEPLIKIEGAEVIGDDGNYKIVPKED